MVTYGDLSIWKLIKGPTKGPIWKWSIWNEEAIANAPDIKFIESVSSSIKGFKAGVTTTTFVVGGLLIYYLLKQK